jgi:hypothetical protein
MEKISTLRGTGALTLAELARAGGPVPELALRVRGTSMSPSLREGDFLTVEPAGAISPGDIVVFRLGDELLCHRVAALREDGSLLTQGDNSSRPDQPVSRADVLGKAASARRGGPDVARLLRQTARWCLRLTRACPGGERVLKALVPAACRYRVAVPVGLRCLDAYSLYDLDDAPAPGASGSDGRVLVAGLFGHTVASLALGGGRVEVSEALAGLGLERSLLALAGQRGSSPRGESLLPPPIRFKTDA